MQSKTIVMPGNPRGKGRPRFYRGHAVTPKATREYERDFAALWKGGDPTNEPVCVNIKSYYCVDSNANKATKLQMLLNKILPTKKPDIDNVIKIVLDSLNEVAYDDDKQVVELHAYKYYSEIPRTEALVTKVDTEEMSHREYTAKVYRNVRMMLIKLIDELEELEYGSDAYKRKEIELSVINNVSNAYYFDLENEKD